MCRVINADASPSRLGRLPIAASGRPFRGPAPVRLKVVDPGARPGQLEGVMDLPVDEQTFLRDLVKASRQKIHAVKWVDRDGTDRQTTLTQAEVVRLNTIADRLKTSKAEVLRQAAHIPVAKLVSIPAPIDPKS